MNWEDEGFIISKRKFRENAILEVFTKKYGKVNGIVYGGNSRKIKKLSSNFKQDILSIIQKMKIKLDILKQN